ncbi:hypothetical protein EPUS_00939 [Endocarpon pusillum Z07020]|uniref:Uncharacterized protein n=1 Tax=Endocarpon pusillum (strain Z07020 / HMAS-L-300199) TaxID=1263415 RepID=U1GP33_ENDPU|nr:uncharacterized protein EPUS_00939 [Endocarpon pusillum Z07020]ERF73686.1 hypothetical protein EPUS_00939 [Endocarpon pusillum Z07020]
METTSLTISVSLKKTLLSDETAVRCLRASKQGSGKSSPTGRSDTVTDVLKLTVLLDGDLNMEELASTLKMRDEARFEFYFVNRFLIESKSLEIPKDARKLRISVSALRLLLSYLEAPPAFVAAVSRFGQPAGRGYRAPQTIGKAKTIDFWYLLPVQIQVECTENALGHARSTAGSSQMDPFHYLHLPDEKVDIRGSQIAVYCSTNLSTMKTTSLCIGFQDGRWSRSVKEPQRRIKEALKHFEHLHCADDPFFIHLVYITSALRWWNNALDSFNNQLIVHEKSLQNQMNNLHLVTPDFNTEINKALHTMTAHLHRYGSELGWLGDIVAAIAQQHETYFKYVRKTPPERTRFGLLQVASHLSAISSIRQELEGKTKNILALLFNNIQVSNDRLLVENSKATHKLLKAARLEAVLSRRLADQSQKIAIEMRKDSVAMKTIALLTAFFLPGTSFAAILAMPFFTKRAWMSGTSRIWLWVALTVPSTILAFAFYTYWKARDEKRSASKGNAVDMCELALSDDTIALVGGVGGTFETDHPTMDATEANTVESRITLSYKGRSGGRHMVWQSPTKPLGVPEDIAKCVKWSTGAGCVTASRITVGGGLTKQKYQGDQTIAASWKEGM